VVDEEAHNAQVDMPNQDLAEVELLSLALAAR